MPITYQVVCDAVAWKALVEEWIELWARAPDAKPFQRPEWLLPWWRQFGQADLRVIVVRQGRDLLAMLPLYVLPGSPERKLMLVGAGTSDYLDGVFAPECGPEHIRAAIRLVANRDGWDRAYFAQVPESSPLLLALDSEGVHRFAGESCGRRAAGPMRALPPKLRADVLFHRNAAAALGRLALEFADEQTWAPMFEQLVRFHTSRWEERGEPGVLADPRVLAHHREAIPLLLRNGLLRLCALRAGTETLGVLYSLSDPPGRAGQTQYYYLMGFAPEHARLRPGTLLAAFAAERAAAEGVATIDMLRGDETYKKFWHVERVPTHGISFERGALGP